MSVGDRYQYGAMPMSVFLGMGCGHGVAAPIQEAFDGSDMEYIGDRVWLAWWSALGAAAADVEVLVHINAGLKRRITVWKGATVKVSVSLPLDEVASSGDFAGYFRALRAEIWRRVADKASWLAPPGTLPGE